jgi:Uma2 family endonuclease
MSIAGSSPNCAGGLAAGMPEEPVVRLSLEQYHEIVRAGIVDEGEPIEFLDGWLVPKMMKTPAHRTATELARRALEAALPGGWHAASQEPLTLAHSEPEPDVSVVRGEVRDYLERHPAAREVALVVEVADSSLRRDRILKKRLYAQAGIPVYWIVNLVETRLEVYLQPGPSQDGFDYGEHRDYGVNDEVPLLLEGRPVALLSVRSFWPSVGPESQG